MDERTIARLRLRALQLVARQADSPAAVVAGLCAVQAQDYYGALWAVAQRMADGAPDATEAGVEQALDAGAIVRHWPMRRTLHFVARADLRWLLALLAPRALAQAVPNRARLGIEERDVARSAEIWTGALAGGRRLTRTEMIAALDAGGVSTEGQHGYHLLVNRAQAGLLCLGPRAGKQQTFVLLDEWVPPAPALDRDEALGRLARRYFTGHGPATLKDFIWWAGLTTGDARTGIAVAGRELAALQVGRTAYWLAADAAESAERAPDPAGLALLLAGFDELLLGYSARSAVLDAAHTEVLHPGGNGVFKPYFVLDGRVAGTWQRTLRKRTVAVEFTPFAPLDDAAHARLEAEAARYAAFLGLAAVVGRQAGA